MNAPLDPSFLGADPVIEDRAKMVVLPSPTARKLEEMSLVYNTLAMVIIVLDHAIATYPDFSKHTQQTQALLASIYRDAVVQFVGCFGKGGGHHRYYLSVEEVYQNQPAAVQFFEYLSGIRDSFAAHRHGAWRQGNVVAVLDDNGRPTEIRVLVGTAVAPYVPELQRFRHFADHARHVAEHKTGMLIKTVLGETQAVSPEELFAYSAPDIIKPDPSRVRMSRTEYYDQEKYAEGEAPQQSALGPNFRKPQAR